MLAVHPHVILYTIPYEILYQIQLPNAGVRRWTVVSAV